MEKRELVSTITPMYNAEKYILETINSVVNQTYDNWEMIIVDNCSTDNSRAIVESIDDSRIRLIRLEYNSGGPARPRNVGLENAKGEYIAFLDADDVWLPQKLEKQLKLIKNNDFDIIHTLAYTIDKRSEVTGKFNNQNIYNKLKIFCSDATISYYSNYININTTLMKKDNTIRFREDKYLVAIEDWLFWIEHLHSNKKVFLFDEVLINYRIDMDSISDRGSDKSYRKTYIMYAILLFEKKLSFWNFIMAMNLNSARMIMKHA